MNHLIAGIVNILFNYLTHVYLERFETLNCICSMDIRRDLCKTFLLVFYVIIAGRILFPDIPNSAKYFVLLFTLLFKVMFISYIFSLKNNKCSCKNVVQDVTTTIMYYYYLMFVFLFIMLVTMIIMFIPMNLFILKK
jgi:hypothetical protein